jgi:hypothetical protein
MAKKTKNTANDSFPKVTLHQLDWLEWTAIILSVWLMIAPYPYIPLFTIVLSLPIVGLILNGISRPSLASLVSLSNENGKNKYDLADFIEFPGLAILVRVLRDFEFESFYSIVKVGTMGFVILLILLISTHKLVQKSNKSKWLIYLTIVGNIALYSYAATYGVNCVYDLSEPKVYSAKVIDKSISRSRRSTTYYIKVEPWGHHKDPERISVQSNTYSNIEIGQTVSIDYKDGLLGIPWYYIDK